MSSKLGRAVLMLSLLPKNIVKRYWYHFMLSHRAFLRPFEIFMLFDVLMLLLVLFVSDMRAFISSIPSEAIFSDKFLFIVSSVCFLL